MANNQPDHIIKAKVFDYAFDNTNLQQYCPGWEVEFNVTQGTMRIPSTNYSIRFVRQLFWLKTASLQPGAGRWIFQFDRANSSSIRDRLWFCKDCGQPFDRFTELGNHEKSKKCKLKAHVDRSEQEHADAEEEAAVAELLKKESGELDTAEIEAVDPEKLARQAEIKQKRIDALNKARAAKKAARVPQPESTEATAQV